MKISAKTEYACRALLELALHWPDAAPIHINTVAQNQQIPLKFLPHILIQLKQQGYVESVRGKKGGYVLLRNPREIILGDIVGTFSDFKIPSKGKKSGFRPNVFDVIWQEVESKLADSLQSITFEEIVRRHRSGEKVPMYTI